MPLKILFADDETSLQELMRSEIPAMGHRVLVCPDGNTAITALQEQSFDCLLVDLDMPGAGGLEVIHEAREKCPEADAIIMTGKGTLDTAITAIREGVFDYLRKPCRLADIEKVLKQVEQRRELNRKYLAVQNQLQRIVGKQELIGSGEGMQEVQRLIERIAPTDSTVVILGETGTGKELVAREIHNRSLRAEKPFVAVNCGALPENLIESELFGHRKGSFTGADANRTGLFQVADGGTLFLDEIGELPKGVQAKLLRFLECGEVRRIGENHTSTCDVRVVCATLRNLETMVRSGEFREDLWFRINTFEILLPPLRERIEDLPQLVAHLAKRNSRGLKFSKIEEIFTEESRSLLGAYYWPGNVRQLANTIEHAFILSDRFPIEPEALPQSIRSPRTVRLQPHCDPGEGEFTESKNERLSRERIREAKPDRPITSRSGKIPIVPSSTKPDAFGDLLSFNPGFAGSASAIEPLPDSEPVKTLRDMENDAIQSSLQRNEGNKAKAAEELGISLKTLYNKLNQQGESKKTA